MSSGWILPGAAGARRLLHRRLVPAAPARRRRRRLPAGSAVRAGAGARAGLPRRLAARGRAVPPRHRRDARAAPRSLRRAAGRQGLPAAAGAHHGRLRRHRPAGRRAERLDHGGRPDAGLAGRAGRHPLRAISSSRWTASPRPTGRWSARCRRCAARSARRSTSPSGARARRRRIRYRLTRERIHQRAVSEGLLLADGVGLPLAVDGAGELRGRAGAGGRPPDRAGA